MKRPGQGRTGPQAAVDQLAQQAFAIVIDRAQAAKRRGEIGSGGAVGADERHQLHFQPQGLDGEVAQRIGGRLSLRGSPGQPCAKCSQQKELCARARSRRCHGPVCHIGGSRGDVQPPAVVSSGPMQTGFRTHAQACARFTATALLAAVLAVPLGLLAQEKQTFTGTITDDMCVGADHSAMRMGSNDAECATACVDAHGANWVLFDGKASYILSDQKTAATLAAKKVRVTGTLDPKTKRIMVDTMRAEP